MNRSVYILGAGCSAKYYPLAKDFRQELSKYADDLSKRPNCDQLKGCVSKTVTLMEQYASPTVDRLILQIMEDVAKRRKSLSTPFGVHRPEHTQLETMEDDQILDAKIATAAFFLEREGAVKDGLQSYRNLLNIIFGGEHGRSALRSTPHRVLSFNYDRLFEIAFGQYFGLDPFGCYGKELLNAGFEYDQSYVLEDFDRFCFLKFHGTAGTFVYEHHGQPRFWHIPAGRTINDTLFWSPSQPKNEPLIVFPYEKDRAADSKTSFPFDPYVRAIWQKQGYAERLVQEAQQIRVIGYSFDPNDRKAMMQLLRQSDCPIIVQNKSQDDAEQICKELRFDYPGDEAFTRSLEPFGKEF
jgi:hypothetical protein